MYDTATTTLRAVSQHGLVHFSITACLSHGNQWPFQSMMTRVPSGFLAKTSNPERALQNLLERDRMFTDRLSKEVANLELRAIHVNTAMAEGHSANFVANMFGL
jgi:hypothetical protein